MLLLERWRLRPLFLLLLIACTTSLVCGKPQHGHTPLNEDEELNQELIENIQNVEIKCATHEITVKIPTPHPHFNGMVYPQVKIKKYKLTSVGYEPRTPKD
jgi:hypothetical protein